NAPTFVAAYVRLAGVSVALGVGTKPVPPTDITHGVPPALLAIERLAFRTAERVGVNDAANVHVAPGTTIVPLHVSVPGTMAKSPGFVPPTPTVPTDRSAVPAFCTVTSWVGAVVPTAVFGKLKLAGDSVKTGAGPPMTYGNEASPL